MNREKIDKQVRSFFETSQTAMAAALSEVQGCFAHPEFLAAVLREMDPSVEVEEAVVQWAIKRGRLWDYRSIYNI